MSGTSTGSLGAWVARLWARRSVIVVCLILGLLAGVAAALLVPRQYAATAVVNVAPLTVNPFGTSQSTQAVNMESERSAVTSTSVIDRAARSLPDQAGAGLGDSITVVVPSQSLILKVTSTTGDAQRAARWANAVAQAYLADRTASADDAAARIIQRLQAEIDARLTARGSQAAADRSLTDADVASLRERISTLTTVGLNPGRITTPAVPPTEPASLTSVPLIVGGLALGLLLGVAAALGADHVGSTVRSAARLSWATGWPVLTLPGGGRGTGVGTGVGTGSDIRTGTTADAAHRATLARAGDAAVVRRSEASPGRFAVLDLAGQDGPALRSALRARLDDLGLVGPEVLDLTDARRPTGRAPLVEPGDVVLLALATSTPMTQVEAVAEVLAARGADVAAAVLATGRARQRPRGAVGSPDAPGQAAEAGATAEAGETPAVPAHDVPAHDVPLAGATRARWRAHRSYPGGDRREARR